MIQKKTLAFLLAILLPVTGLLGVYIYTWGPAGNSPNQPGIFGTTGPCFNVTVLIDYGSEYGGNQSYAGLDFPEGATAFDALCHVASVDYQYYGSFVLVRGINGVYNNVSVNRFWQYYVDGVFGPIASNLYHLGNNSILEWRYQPSQF